MPLHPTKIGAAYPLDPPATLPSSSSFLNPLAECKSTLSTILGTLLVTHLLFMCKGSLGIYTTCSYVLIGCVYHPPSSNGKANPPKKPLSFIQQRFASANSIKFTT
ncbi:hypothetical protein Dimus_000224 [Dionaea muscipula]